MKPTKESALLTIAAIRKSKRGEATRYLFNERQQIFDLPRGTKSFGECTRILKQSLGGDEPVKALLNPRQGVIERIEPPSQGETEKFLKSRILLDKPQRLLPVNLERIDPTQFNLVDRYLRSPLFRLCKRVIPNYRKAKEVFDFCAKQSCHLGGPYAISPCIPFQYVIDGCYARAHKMRWIITEKYDYCCEKVFSFAVDDDDTLAVKADKWGGCCVEWWYHVAPLVRVRLKFGSFSIVLAMVIDPGMFNKPVLLSSWLAAQENKTCNPHAHVSKYSIQPGSAYAPAFGSSTTFSTDPSYVATDQTLVNYHNLTTCS
jgi:hypothetical protein